MTDEQLVAQAHLYDKTLEELRELIFAAKHLSKLSASDLLSLIERVLDLSTLGIHTAIMASQEMAKGFKDHDECLRILAQEIGNIKNNTNDEPPVSGDDWKFRNN